MSKNTTSTQGPARASNRAETGAATIKIDLSGSNISVTHGDTGEVLLNRRVEAGFWDRLWLIIREEPTRPSITGFAHYKGHVIDVERCGSQQAQNIYIDGKSAGFVLFPTPAFATAREIIDAREDA